MTPRRRWTLAPDLDPATYASFAQSPLWALLLAQRGMQRLEDVERFLKPQYGRDLHDPFLFRAMPVATERIVKAIRDQELIAVYGDYDADGVCSSVLLAEAIEALGGRVRIYIPDRLSEGYGLNVAALDLLIDEGASLIISVDCGSTAVAEVAHARSRGADVIITDHHDRPDVLPDAVAILNPEFPEETYPWKHLSAAGVAFKLVQGLLRVTDRGTTLGREPLPLEWEKWLLDLVAISTIADVVPLQGENRALATFGLLVLRRSRRLGLRALADAMRRPLVETDEETIGYQVGPRINAAGRMQHASLAVDLLRARDPATAAARAGELEQLNVERQRLSERILADAVSQAELQADAPAIVVYGPDWPAGVIGLIAGRIADRYQRPTIVLGCAQGDVVGSGRSVPGFDITAGVRELTSFLTKVGGHPQACGLTIINDNAVESFRSAFQDVVRARHLPGDGLRSLDVSTRLTLKDIDDDFVDFLDQLRPYGEGNPSPTFLLEALTVHDAQLVGREGKHLRLSIGDGSGARRSSIGFSLGHAFADVPIGSSIDAVTRLRRSMWRGERRIDIHLLDLRGRP